MCEMHNVILTSSYQYSVKSSKVMNALCEKYFCVWKMTKSLFLNFHTCIHVAQCRGSPGEFKNLENISIPETSRALGKPLEIYNVRNWWRIGIQGDIRIHIKKVAVSWLNVCHSVQYTNKFNFIFLHLLLSNVFCGICLPFPWTIP